MYMPEDRNKREWVELLMNTLQPQQMSLETQSEASAVAPAVGSAGAFLFIFVSVVLVDFVHRRWNWISRRFFTSAAERGLQEKLASIAVEMKENNSMDKFATFAKLERKQKQYKSEYDQIVLSRSYVTTVLRSWVAPYILRVIVYAGILLVTSGSMYWYVPAELSLGGVLPCLGDARLWLFLVVQACFAIRT